MYLAVQSVNWNCTYKNISLLLWFSPRRLHGKNDGRRQARLDAKPRGGKARTRTSKRMIYYYFGDKMGLYTQALEAAYHKVREGEASLDLDHLPPLEALEKLVSFTFDHHRRNPDFIRMVMIENIHQAEALIASDKIRDLNIAAIEKLREICVRGEKEGVFRSGLDPVALHWQISAASFFNVSNQPTFTALFGGTLFGEAGQQYLRSQTVKAIVAIARSQATFEP